MTSTTPWNDPATTAADVVRMWDAGETVFTVEMGGLGPGYEQAIQVLVIELLRDNAALPSPGEVGTWGDATARKHSAALGGLSEAQVGAAKSLAYRILRDGYTLTLDSMRKNDSSRVIQVSNRWPMLSKSAATPAETTPHE